MDYEFITITINNLTHGAITGDGNVRPSADRVKEIQSRVVFWAIVDGILLFTILSGNILTMLAVRFSRKLRSIISNLFVLSLAISDMLVGFTLPYHLAFYLGSGLGSSISWCLMRFFLIIIACCVSIWNLIAIAVDRYIAIVYPLHYSRYMTRKVALILISIGWIVGAAIASIPMFWNNWLTATECEFDEILPPWYMAGIITPVFSMVWLCMLILYWRIWREASKHAKQLRSSFTGLHEGPSDWKSVQVVLLILGCFSICWLPYFIVACAQIFKFLEESSPTVYKAAFSLAMANSGMNPIIYAWKNTNFRRAFCSLLRCRSPDSYERNHQNSNANSNSKSKRRNSSTINNINNNDNHHHEATTTQCCDTSLNGCTIITNTNIIIPSPIPQIKSMETDFNKTINNEDAAVDNSIDTIKNVKIITPSCSTINNNNIDNNQLMITDNAHQSSSQKNNNEIVTTGDLIICTNNNLNKLNYNLTDNYCDNNNNNNSNNNNNTKHIIVNKLENLDHQQQNMNVLTKTINHLKNDNNLVNKSIACIVNENNCTIICNVKNVK